jgi:hypothetical protein
MDEALKQQTMAEPLPAGFRLTELGPRPEAWQVMRLGEVFEIQQGKSLSPKSRSGSRMRPFLRTANVLWGRVDLFTKSGGSPLFPNSRKSLASWPLWTPKSPRRRAAGPRWRRFSRACWRI